MTSTLCLRSLVCLAFLLAMPGVSPSESRRKWTEANMPADFATYLSDLAARVHVVRLSRKERSRPPGVGLMAAALGHAYGVPGYPSDPEDRRLMEDVLTVLEKDPARSHEVPALRARMVAHYVQTPTLGGGGTVNG